MSFVLVLFYQSLLTVLVVLAVNEGAILIV